MNEQIFQELLQRQNSYKKFSTAGEKPFLEAIVQAILELKKAVDDQVIFKDLLIPSPINPEDDGA